MEGQQGVLETLGETGLAFKRILDFGGIVAEVSIESVSLIQTPIEVPVQLDPSGGAKLAFSACINAWEVCLQKP
jgi:hypothetical protein